MYFKSNYLKYLLMSALIFTYINMPTHAQSSHSLSPPANTPVPTVRDMKHIETMMKEVLKDSFPELKDIQIKIQPLHEDAFYFASNFEPLSLFTPSPLYIIQANSKMFSAKLPTPAARAILAHELAHTLDYVKGGIPGIIGIGIKVLNENRVYEHRTDLQAIYRGYGIGLIDYRKWIYPTIPAKDLAEKKATYYQPTEIAALIDAFTEAKAFGKKEALYKIWYKSPPFGIKQIQKELHQLLYLHKDFYSVQENL